MALNGISEFEQKLGHTFSQPSLLTQALTHRSFGLPHNERLEFLGDAFLNAFIAKSLYDRHPDLPEGDLSRLRANLVNQAALASIAAELGIGEALRLGDGEIKTGGRARPSILADAVESLIGATYLDAGAAAAENLVHRLFAPLLVGPMEATASKDAKTGLQEWLQARRLPLPQYVVAQIEGAAHQQVFRVWCSVESEGVRVQGTGTTRRAAEQDAAAQALQRLITTTETAAAAARGRRK